MKPQESIKNTLESLSLPFNAIKVYGSQITIECESKATCEKFSSVIINFATIRNIIETSVYCKDQQGKNMPKLKKAFRLYAKIN